MLSLLKRIMLFSRPDTSISSGFGGNGIVANKAFNSAIIGESLPRGRGVDERAARAAAEARKKAPARGLLTLPHGVPVQALPPLTQFLNVINSGTTPDAADNNAPDGEKKEANSKVINGKPDPKENLLKPGQQDQAPPWIRIRVVAALDVKKQKSKAKATSSLESCDEVGEVPLFSDLGCGFDKKKGVLFYVLGIELQAPYVHIPVQEMEV